MCLEFRRGRVSDICSHTAAPSKSFGNRRRSAHKAWSSSKSMPVRTRLLDSCWTPTDDFIISILFYWRSLGKSEKSLSSMGLPILRPPKMPLKRNGDFCDWQTVRGPYSEVHLVRDEGVAGSNPATPT